MDRRPNHNSLALVVLAVLGMVAATYLLKPILAPVALALLLACLLSPATWLLRKILPIGPIGASVVLFLLALISGLYVTSLVAESLVQATNTVPYEIERAAGRLSWRVNDMIRDQPYLKAILPDPITIDKLGDANSTLLFEKLSFGLVDFSTYVVQGLIVLVLVLFLLAESEMLIPKVIRFFAHTPGDAAFASKAINDLTRQIRAYLIARTFINLGVGLAFAFSLSLMKVKFAVALGLFAGLTNFVPYAGQFIGGALPTVIALGQFESFGDACIVSAIYLGILGVEGYIVTPYVMGRSLDLNGTTVLITCLFWGFLWGLVGLFLAMPITVFLKLVFQSVPELNRWAELMSLTWQSPPQVDPSTIAEDNDPFAPTEIDTSCPPSETKSLITEPSAVIPSSAGHH